MILEPSWFLPGHSTVYQLLETYHSIVKSIDDGNYCCMMFCDLSKAFDRVWHKGLIHKLKSYGVSGPILEWFISYLSNRTQKVMYKNKLSSSQFINAGVPQGSVLGPLLFLLYVNDVAENMRSICRLYADDSSLQQCSNNISVIEDNLNYDLHVLKEWSKQWLLEFNPQKTKVVFFSFKNVEKFPNLLFDDCTLEYVSQHKHLGVLLSSNLSWSNHIDIIVKKAYKKLGLLKKLKFTVSRDILAQMYVSFIRPQLEYAVEVWSGCTQFDMDKLEKVQLYAARIVSGLSVIASRNSLYLETGWEPLITRRDRLKLSTMFKIHNNLVPSYLKDITPGIRNVTSNYNTRNSSNYSLPRCRLEAFNKSFFPDTIRKWNSLNNNTKEATSLNIFKKSLQSNYTKPPKYFSFGKRFLNIIHTKLRHNCVLNCDLYRCNIIANPMCSCGSLEDAHHLFFVCKKYSSLRQSFMYNLLSLNFLNIIDVHLLLWGDNTLSYDENIKIFKEVHTFIQKCGRFI